MPIVIGIIGKVVLISPISVHNVDVTVPTIFLPIRLKDNVACRWETIWDPSPHWDDW